MSTSNIPFALSSQGKLALCISIAITSTSYSADIISANDGPEVYSSNGVTIVDINQPNSQGLSHNEYSQYNVSQSGAVLNNAVNSGTSQLAGELQANNNLNETAATVILNEVVSKKPSSLLGTQEVFGQSADYVLANPNGITCDGCGFINTPTASLVVGDAEIENGKIEQFNTSGNSNSLTTRGSIHSDGNLNLIAPKIDIGGEITTEQTITIVGGHQTVNYDDPTQQTVVTNTQSSDEDESTPLDGKVFGSIQAGRIRIHHTDDTATLAVKSANLKATEDLAIQSRGTLDIKGTVTSTAGPSDSQSDYDWGTMITTESSEDSETQTYQGTQLQAKNVTLSGDQSVNIAATDIDAEADLSISGGDIELTAVTTENTTTSHDKASKLAWFNQTDTTTTTQTTHSNQFNAGGDVTIDADNNATVSATQIVAEKDVNISADKTVSIKGAIATDTSETINSYQNETAALKTGDHTQQSTTQTLSTSGIQAGSDIAINAETVEGKAVTLSAKNVVINADDELRIETQTINNSSVDSEVFTYWGGIGGGETHASESKSVTNTQSTISADDISLSGQGGVELTAAILKSSNNIDLSANNGMVDINYTFDYEESLRNDRHGTAFNITDESGNVATEVETTLASTITAGENIDINANDINIVASDLSAKQQLMLSANNSITADIATAQNTVSTENFSIGTTGYTDTDGDALTAEAGVKLQGITHTVVSGVGTTTANSLTASNITIKSADSVDLKGSQIVAVNNQGEGEGGTINISGADVSIGAGLSRTDTQIDYVKADGASLYVSGSLEKVAVGFTIGTEQTREVAVTDTAIKTTITGQQATLSADNELLSQGTDITVSGILNMTAQVIENLGSHDVTQTHKIDANGGVRVEAYASVSPEIGVAVTLGGEGEGTKGVVKTAQVDTLQADSININGSTSVTDTGTQYQADTVTIQTTDYTGNAAQNSDIARTNTGMGELGLSVSTSDFASVTITASAAAAHQHLEVGETTAVLGDIDANNITISATNDLLSSMNMTANSLNLVAGNNLEIQQANDQQWAMRYGFDTSGSLGVTYVPEANIVTPSFSLSLAGNYSAVKDTQAVTSTLTAETISINADSQASIEGASITATDNVYIAAKQITIDAATDKHEAFGVKADANASLSLTIGDTVTGGSFGLGANFAIVDEDSETKHGSHIEADTITIGANEAQEASDLLINGATLVADTLTINNAGGRVLITAAENFVKKGNWGIGGNIGLSASKDSAKVTDIGGHLDIDWEDSYSYEVGSITASTFNITSGQDTTLQTDVQADTINGNIGGNLAILSAQDHTHAFAFNTSAYFSGSPYEYTAETTVSDVIENIHNDYQNGTVFGISAGFAFNLQSNNTKATQVSTIDAETMNWNVEGSQVEINSAQVSSNGGSNFGDAIITETNNIDYTHDFGFEISAETPNFKEMFTQLITGQDVESPISADGHLTWTDDETIETSLNLN